MTPEEFCKYVINSNIFSEISSEGTDHTEQGRYIWPDRYTRLKQLAEEALQKQSQKRIADAKREMMDKCGSCSLWRIEKVNYCPSCGNYLKHQDLNQRLENLFIEVDNIIEQHPEIVEEVDQEQFEEAKRLTEGVETEDLPPPTAGVGGRNEKAMKPNRKSRSPLCPCQRTCTPIYNGLSFDERINGGDLNEGYSGDCIGKSHELEYMVGGNLHKNDMNHCIFSPLKGIVRFMINQDDIEAMYMMSRSVLAEINPIQCDMCGKDARFSLLRKIGNRLLCRQCEEFYKIAKHGGE